MFSSRISATLALFFLIIVVGVIRYTKKPRSEIAPEQDMTDQVARIESTDIQGGDIRANGWTKFRN